MYAMNKYSMSLCVTVGAPTRKHAHQDPNEEEEEED